MRPGLAAVQHDRKFRTELGFSHVRWALTRGLGRRRGGGLKAWLQWLGNHPVGSNWPSLTRSSSGLATPGAWSASMVGR
jgi:hypothetical protein